MHPGVSIQPPLIVAARPRLLPRSVRRTIRLRASTSMAHPALRRAAAQGGRVPSSTDRASRPATLRRPEPSSVHGPSPVSRAWLALPALLKYSAPSMQNFTSSSRVVAPRASQNRSALLPSYRLAVSASPTPFPVLQILAQLVRPEHSAAERDQPQQVAKPDGLGLENLLQPGQVDDE